ncbi:hypothetical protein F2P81_005673 [Scophthalmus maximus]|uniref:Uncharacterized protein n=1 Tax=Scophthalmus maximus TaxID=52904 RepID=A0A6A4TH31_SCOMX|nr:hypothetical protein F2P81_005673 [Scophthalmus maximus]
MRWRTAMSPDLPREGRSKVTETLSPAPFRYRLRPPVKGGAAVARVACGTGSARSAPTGTSHKWSDETGAECAGLTRRTLSLQVHSTQQKVAATGDVGQAAVGFNGGSRATFVPAK